MTPAGKTMTPAARRLTLFLLTLIFGFGFIDRVMIALVAERLKADFGLTDLEIGLVGGTAFAVVNTLATIPIARLAERRARTRVVGVALAIGSVCTALCAATSSFVQLLVARLGMAIGAAGSEAPSHSVISDLYPSGKRASALSLFMLGVPIASILGSFAGGSIAQAYGWRATFLFFGLTGLVVALLGLGLMREPARSEAEGPVHSLGTVAATLWQHGRFRLILIGTALVSLASFGVNTFLPAFFTRNYGLGAGEAGLAFGLVVGIASAVGSVLGGYGSEWLARRRPDWLMLAPGLGLFVGAPLLMLGVTRGDLWVAMPLILVGSIFFYTAMAPAIATTHAFLDPRSRATGSALFMLCIHLVGQGAGAPLAGFLSDRLAVWSYGGEAFRTECIGAAAQVAGSACAAASATGLRLAIVAFAAIYLAGGLCYCLATRKERIRP